MARTNLTIQLDEGVIRQARVVAARRGTSVSALVARELERLAEEDGRYEEARRRASEVMAKARSRGGRGWTRDDIYTERLERHGR